MITMGSEILDKISYVKTINKQKATIIQIVKCLRNNYDPPNWDEDSFKGTLMYI